LFEKIFNHIEGLEYCTSDIKYCKSRKSSNVLMWLDDWSNCGSTRFADALDIHAVIAVGGIEQGCIQTTHEASSLTPSFTAVHTCIRYDESFPPSAFHRLRPSCNRITFKPTRHAVAPTTVKRANIYGYGYNTVAD